MAMSSITVVTTFKNVESHAPFQYEIFTPVIDCSTRKNVEKSGLSACGSTCDRENNETEFSFNNGGDNVVELTSVRNEKVESLSLN